MGVWRWLLGGRSRSEHIALLVDGPNVLRPEFDVDLSAVHAAASGGHGPPGIARVYVDEHASPGLIRAAEANGYEVVVTSGDVDVKLAVEATELLLGGEVDVLAIASRDADFKPVFEVAGDHGIRTLAIAPGRHGRSSALVNAADNAVVLED